MTCALIDNATITAVQRLLGVASSRSRDSVEGDIAALENLVEAILFYDHIASIDNYKHEFRVPRAEQFPFVNFLGLDNRYLRDLDTQARAETESLRPEIRGGEFADEDFRSLLDQLRMHMACTWDLSQSTYYLTMKMIGEPDTPEFEKYSQLSASIFGELADHKQTTGPNPFAKECALVDSQGNPIRDGYEIRGAKSSGGATGGMSTSLRAFVASLSWSAFKTIYYTLAARALKADAFLYPIRQSFQLQWLQKRGIFDVDFSKAVVERFTKESTSEVATIVQSTKPYTVTLSLPFFSAWLVTEAGGIGGVIPAAVELRDDKRFVTAREQLSQLRFELDNGDPTKAVKSTSKLCRDIDESIGAISSEFSIRTKQRIPLRPLIQIYNLIASCTPLPHAPEIDANISLPSFLQNIGARNGFSILYRDIVRDLTDIPRLGDARDLLGAGIRLHKDGAHAHSPKPESPKYRHVHSSWKSPM